MTAKWKYDNLIKADANQIASEIEEIGEEVTAAQIVEKARDERSELHKCFEWDDSIAAEKYRLEQARYILRVLVIQHPEEDKAENPPIRYFQKTNNNEGFKPSKIIFHKQDEYQALLKRAWEELRAFKQKYSMLQELDEILALID